MKKTFTLILALLFTCAGLIVDTNALENTNKTTKISEDELVEYFSERELYELYQEQKKKDQEELEQGFKKVSTEYFITEEINTKSRDYSPGIYFVSAVNKYNSAEKILNDKSKGMYYWLDLTWNIAIGSTTKHLWKAATVLNITPSRFSSRWISGDKLSQTVSKVETTRYYKKYNSLAGYDVCYLTTRRQELTVYVDLYTFDIANNSVRKTSMSKGNYSTIYYANDQWISNTVNSRCKANLNSTPIVDAYK